MTEPLNSCRARIHQHCMKTICRFLDWKQFIDWLTFGKSKVQSALERTTATNTLSYFNRLFKAVVVSGVKHENTFYILIKYRCVSKDNK